MWEFVQESIKQILHSLIFSVSENCYSCIANFMNEIIVCHFFLQGMDELDLTIFTYGGVNMTGFRLLNYSSPTLKGFLRTWSSLSNESWPRPVRGRIGVRQSSPHF